LNKKLEDITNKGVRLYFDMYVNPLLQMQGFVDEISLDIIASDGQPVSCLFSARAIKNEDGSIHHINAVLFRITDRKNYEAEILRAKNKAVQENNHQQQTVDELSIRLLKVSSLADQREQILQAQRRIMSILGHDTRAPLFSINRILKFAVEGQISADDMLPYFELITNQLDTTLILIDNLINWGKAHLNPGKESLVAFSLQELTDEVFQLLSSNAISKGLYMTNAVDAGLTLVSNRPVVTFIIRNLVNNAIKFTSSGGIVVEAATSDDFVHISVTDTGVGITSSQLATIARRDAASTAGTEFETGSGIGLMLIYEFLLQLQGELAIESEPMKGTKITVRLPNKKGS
jgi:sigma-B regulation protein RsbU (phosphoserine phosphatase)